MQDLTSKTAIVVGASRGLGRAIAECLAEAGANVIAVSRTGTAPSAPAKGAGTIRPEGADASDVTVPARLLGRYEPDVVVLVAGATPPMLPLQQQTWETFSANWQSDVQITFNWLREILLKPLRPGSKVIEQRRCARRLAAKRRIRGRQKHPAIHSRIRAGRGKAHRS